MSQVIELIDQPIHRRGVLDETAVASTGSIGGFSYYTSQPAPHQWVAIATMSDGDGMAGRDLPCRMIVGTGRTEADAIDDLYERIVNLRPVAPVDALIADTSDVMSLGGA